jgi:glycosyltransferase involved in cell wall biosynthesis
MRIGYVVKRYPRFSETFVVTEILAHEAAGAEIAVFSLRPPVDTHFQDAISRVRAPVTYLCAEGLKAASLWEAIEEAGGELPGFFSSLEAARGWPAAVVYQAALLARESRRRGLHHLHAHFASEATAVARLAARFAGLSYSFTAHAKDIYHEGVAAAGLRQKLLDAASVVTVSDFNLAHLRRSFGPAAARTERIYNGLDLSLFPFRVPDPRPPRLVAVGRLVEKKGFDDLVDACAILDRSGRRFACEIIGGGEAEADLRLRVRSLRLEGRVSFLGPRPQAEVAARVQEAAALAAPCVVGADGNRDGLPTTLLEAMALGTPCVSTDVTGIPEVLRSEETGLMVPQRDPAALASALGRLLDDVPLRLALARRARALIEAEFDSQRNASSLRAVFARSAALPAAPRAS